MVLPRGDALNEGVSPDALRAFVDAQQGQEMHSLMVLRHGRVVAEHWWEPWRPGVPGLVYSLSKTFTSAAVGLCVAEGRFGYDDTIAELLPWLAGDATEVTRRIRVRDCLAMATGHEVDLIDLAGRISLDEQAVHLMLATEPTGTPGETFCYNQIATYTLSVLVHHATGLDLLEYLRPRLFDPLGAPPLRWTRDSDGRCQGFSGLHVDSETIAAFFQLLLDDGHLAGRQVLPPEWIERHRQPQVSTLRQADTPDWQQGYGWQCWRARHGYRGDGAFGQYGIVLPEHDMVVVITSQVRDMQPTLDNLWTHLLPGVTPDAPAGGGSGALPEGTAATIVQHQLPPLASALPTSGGDGTLALRASHEVQGEEHWISWTERGTGGAPDTQQRCPVGIGEWRHHELAWPAGTLPVAASGVVVGDELHVRLCLVSTPHSIELATGDEGWARWLVNPLGVVRSPGELAVGGQG